MYRAVLIGLVAAAVFTACGEGEKTRVVVREPTTTTTEAPDPQWRRGLQLDFLSKCGLGQRCQCALAELEDRYPDPHDLPPTRSAEFDRVSADVAQGCF